MWEILETKVSQAFWCKYTGKTGSPEFEEASVGVGRQAVAPLFWLDRLLRGGIRVPSNSTKPTTLLITGPPGSAKTTLALEMCYRLASESGKHSLFISLDTDADSVVAKADDLGFRKARSHVTSFPNGSKRIPSGPIVSVWGVNNVRKSQTMNEVVSEALEAITKKILGSPQKKLSRELADRLLIDHLHKTKHFVPDVIVLDSLNILEPNKEGEYFERFLSLAPSGTKLLIIVLDAHGSGHHAFWEFISDIVIRLDYESPQNYYVRTLEIVKARHQAHVWGRHQLKIYSPFKVPERRRDQDLKDYAAECDQIRRRAHPYRDEGGIFVYPSIHYYLSLYKRFAHTEPPVGVQTTPTTFDRLVRFPKGRCSALVGRRGGHKSHLGFVHILHRIVSHGELGLILSLRDDERMTADTLGNILEQEFGRERVELDDLLRDGHLEILYFHPGYITPEEFFHRMFMSIQRLKSLRKQSITVLFNALDGLAARFPLCAKQEIFVPGMVEMLSGEGITSIFIGVDEPGQPLEQYGLLPMADLILSFYPHRFSFESYYGHLNETWGLDRLSGDQKIRVERLHDSGKGSYKDVTVMQIVRHSGGHQAGAMGLLELVEADQHEHSLYPKSGLHFTPLSTHAELGKPL